MPHTRTTFIRLWMLAVLAVLAACAGTRAGELSSALLWRIDRPGLPPSYLFGTMHAEDRRVTTLAPPVAAAFDTSRQFVMETVLNAGMDERLRERMYYGEGRDLEQVVGTELYARLKAAPSLRHIPGPALRRMKPWVVASILSMPEAETGMFLDRRLQERAESQGKPVHGLESLAEQLAAFEDMPERSQVALLGAALDRVGELDSEIEKMTLAYIKRDLAAIQAAYDESLSDLDPDTRAAFAHHVVTNRNLHMAARIPQYVQSGGAFIAVGTLHLPGKQGLITLLRERGYTLTPVY